MIRKPLRVLFASGYFPPKAPIGAVRPGKLAQHWQQAGHDVRVIAVALPPAKWAHDTDPGITTAYLEYSEPGQFVTRLLSGARQSYFGRFLTSASKTSLGHVNRNGALRSFEKVGIGDIYRNALCMPDRYRSWIRAAVRHAKSWETQWRPDLIYSSGPPNSGHIVAKALAKHFSVPWIAECRDAWIGNPYRHRHWPVESLLNLLGRRTLRAADALVVLTDSDRKKMSEIFPVPVVLAYNGYDPREFEHLGAVPALDPDHLTILHAGVIYPGQRDPTPLFRAIAELGPQAQKVKCLFYGVESCALSTLAQTYGVATSVKIGGILSRSQILSLERQVDVLLELHWDNPVGDGVIPGKIFEYIGARRPILSLGSPTAESSAIVRENRLGLASNDSGEIRVALMQWLANKQRCSRLPDVGLSANEQFQRVTQFEEIDLLIEKLTAAPEGRMSVPIDARLAPVREGAPGGCSASGRC